MSNLPSYAQAAKKLSHNSHVNISLGSWISSYTYDNRHPTSFVYDNSHSASFAADLDSLDSFPPLSHAKPLFSSTKNSIHGNYWGRVRNIGDKAIVKLVARLLPGEQHDEYSVQEQLSGAYNVIYIVFNRRRRNRVCLTISSTGHENRWMAADAIALRSEALTMHLIKNKTKCPIPTVFAYDNTMKNEIAAPYILMSFVEGRQLSDMEEFWAEAGVYEEKYDTLLQSLAHSMAELSGLQFPRIGMLEFPNDSTQVPSLGGLRDEYILDLNMMPNMDHEDVKVARMWKIHGPYQTSQEYFVSRYQNLPERPSQDPSSESVHKLLELVISSVPLSGVNDVNAGETFTLAHLDLHAANIFCDEDGHVTGIIDWEGARVVPMYLGYAAVPLWLRNDWEEVYNWPFQDDHLSPSELARQRNLYTAAMRERLHENDGWMYPTKSVMLTALDLALDALYAGNLSAAKQFMNKILHAVLPTTVADDFYSSLATSDGIEQFLDADAGTYIREELQELFQCDANARILHEEETKSPESPPPTSGSSQKIERDR